MWIEHDGQAVNLHLMNSFFKVTNNDHPHNETYHLEFHSEDDYVAFEFKSEKERNEMYDFILAILEGTRNLLRFMPEERKYELLD